MHDNYYIMTKFKYSDMFQEYNIWRGANMNGSITVSYLPVASNRHFVSTIAIRQMGKMDYRVDTSALEFIIG